MTRENAALEAQPRAIARDQAILSVAFSGDAAGAADPAAPESTLAGATSRELRATLALISGYSQSLLHLSLDEPTRRQYLERMSQAAESLSRLADRILDLADAGSERPALRRQPVSLSWLLDHLTQELAETSASRAITYWIPPLLPLIDADPAWIGHVLRNLVTNATRCGAETVTIRARAVEEGVVVSVHDDGDELDPAARDRVFDPTARGSRSARPGARWSGVNLCLCQQLVEAHGGRMWVDDASGGMSISFSLPTLESREPAAVPVALPGTAALEESPGRPGFEVGPLVPASGGAR
jgi:two-component system sensor histidine kinase KdpD